MSESAIRFAVQNIDGRRAATWKCWSPSGKEDVYLACRELGGALKASLHESGNWHFAYFENFFEERVPEEYRTDRGRFIGQWSRPNPIAPGITLAFRIVTPWTSVTSQGGEPASLIAVPPPGDGKAVEFDIFLVDRTTRVTGLPGKNKMNTKLVGTYTLPSGTSIWVIWWEGDMPSFGPLRVTPKYYRGSSLEDLKGEGIRMLAFGSEPDGSRVIYDCVGKFDPVKA